MPTGGSFGSGEPVVARHHGGRSVVPGGGSPASGAAILAAMRGWWHAATYIGSGNFLNSGASGSALDAVLGATSAAPTFTTDHFSFDGADDIMTVANNAALDVAANQSFHFGCIIKQNIAPNSGRGYMGRGSGTDPNNRWSLRSVAATYAPSLLMAMNAGAVAVTGATIYTLGVKEMFSGSRNGSTGVMNAWTGNVSQGTATPGTGSNFAASLPLLFGQSADVGAFQVFDLYGAFLHVGAELTPAQLLDVAAYYGV